MEGLEVIEINFQGLKDDNDVFRYDAEYFRKLPLTIVSKIKKLQNFRIKDEFDVSKLAGFEFSLYFTPTNTASENYYVALTSKNIQNERLALNDFITIDKNVSDQFLTRSKLFSKDVVLSYTGEYRRSLVLFSNGFQLGPNVCRIRPKTNGDLSFYVSTFLNSKIGQIILDREKTLSAQPTVAMSRIREIQIPIYEKLTEKLRIILTESHDLENNSRSFYSQAEALLLKSLGLYNSPLREGRFAMQNGEGSSFGIGNPDKADKFSHLSINQKSFKESFQKTGRLDAEYYQPKYEDYQSHIFSYSESWLPLEKICNLKDKNYSPSDERFYQYIELADIDKNGGITGCSKELGKDLPSRARRKINAGDVLISSIEGSLSSCAIVSKEFDNSLCSTGFYVIKSDKINSETLLVLFKSELMQNILKQSCSGTILTAINKDEFLKIPLPLINPKTQSQISSFIQESFTLKSKSEKLLEVAKKAVEMAIEESEEKAIKFIKENS